MKHFILALLLAAASTASAEMYNRGLSYTASSGGWVGEAAALNMGRVASSGLWVPLSATAHGDLAVEICNGSGTISSTNPLPIAPPQSGSLNVNVTAGLVTWTAACETAKLYQTHYIVTATTGTVTFVLASPTAAGKIIRVKAFHTYATNATANAIVKQYARDSLTGVTVSVSSVYLPNNSATAIAQIEVDNDDNNMWGPCGWPMSAGALLQCNLTANITGGEWIFHVVWWEE